MWYRTSNKNRNFVRQIANKESRTRYYATLSEELTKTQAPTTPRAINDNEDIPNDPTMHYEIPKMASAISDLTEFVIEHQSDRAFHVSHRVT